MLSYRSCSQGSAKKKKEKRKEEKEKERLSLTNPCGLEGISALETAGAPKPYSNFFSFCRNYFFLSRQIPLLFQYSAQSFSPANHQLDNLLISSPTTLTSGTFKSLRFLWKGFTKKLQRIHCSATRRRHNKLAVRSPKLHFHMPVSQLLLPMATVMLSIYLQIKYVRKTKCHSTALWPHPLCSVALLVLSVLFWIVDIDTVSAIVFLLIVSFCLILHQVSCSIFPQ
jgi:hypothetical protein